MKVKNLRILFFQAFFVLAATVCHAEKYMYSVSFAGRLENGSVLDECLQGGNSEVLSVAQKSDSKVNQGPEAKVNQGPEAKVNQGPDMNAAQGEEWKVAQGEDARVAQGEETKVAQGEDARVAQGEETKVAQGEEAKMVQGEDARVAQGKEAKVVQKEEAKAKQNIRELLPYADFENWLSRIIKESDILGGDSVTVYSVADNGVIRGNRPYVNTKSPWASSNVYAEVKGVTKTNVNVRPGVHGNGKCAVLSTEIMSFKVFGAVKVNVLAAGAIYTGVIKEPVSSLSDSFGMINMGIPFTRKPSALVFDYASEMRNSGTVIKASGLSRKESQGRDKAIVLVILQKRWEKDGKIYAKRIATGEMLIDRSMPWQENSRIELVYGKPASPFEAKYANLHSEFYALNSEGKSVPVNEVGWGDDTPTHLIVYISSGSLEPYMGEPGNRLMIDNVGFEY